jgi:cytochrome P450
VRINPYELHIHDPDFYSTLYCGPTSKRDKWPWAARMFGNTTSVFSTVSHEHHRVRRSALNPLFSKANIQKLEPMIQSVLMKLCQRFDSFSNTENPVDIGLGFTVFAADVITTYCFGESLNLVDEPDFAREWVAMVAAPSELAHLVKQCPWVLSTMRLVPRHILKLLYPAIAFLYDVQHVSIFRMPA